MQLSCLPVSFFPDIIEGRMALGEWARMGRELGLDAIDISFLFAQDRSPQALAAMRRQVEDEGMSITMMSTYPDFTHPDKAQRERELALEQESVGVAAALGVRLVRVVAGQAHPKTGREEGIGWAVEGIHKLVERAGNLGPKLVYENHGKPGAWQYTDFSQPADIFLEIVKGTADIDLPINFDTANAVAFTEDPLGLLEQIIDRVISVHAADTTVKGQLTPTIIGQGIAPIGETLSRLHRSGWDGWICIEEASREGRHGVDEAAKFVRKTWAEVVS